MDVHFFEPDSQKKLSDQRLDMVSDKNIWYYQDAVEGVPGVERYFEFLFHEMVDNVLKVVELCFKIGLFFDVEESILDGLNWISILLCALYTMGSLRPRELVIRRAFHRRSWVFKVFRLGLLFFL